MPKLLVSLRRWTSFHTTDRIDSHKTRPVVFYVLVSVAMRCRPVPKVPHQQSSGSRYVFNETVKFSCDSGYRLIGSSVLRCLSTGRWSAPLPRCVNVCPTIVDPANGAVIGGKKDDETRVGATAVYSCNPGYRLTKPATAKCQDDAKWSVTGQSCVRVQCPALPARADLNGALQPEKQTYAYGDSVVLTCNKGYVVNGTAEQTMTCGVDGSWNMPDRACSGEFPWECEPHVYTVICPHSCQRNLAAWLC